MSSRYMKPARPKMRACADEANGSSTRMSAPSERPKVAPSPTSNVVPGSSPIAAITSRRGETPARRSGMPGTTFDVGEGATFGRSDRSEEVEDDEEPELERNGERLVHA